MAEPNYKYRVCKGKQVVALTTTLREAEAEARRCGGRVESLTKPTLRRNNPKTGSDAPGANLTTEGSTVADFRREVMRAFEGQPVEFVTHGAMEVEFRVRGENCVAMERTRTFDVSYWDDERFTWRSFNRFVDVNSAFITVVQLIRDTLARTAPAVGGKAAPASATTQPIDLGDRWQATLEAWVRVAYPQAIARAPDDMTFSVLTTRGPAPRISLVKLSSRDWAVSRYRPGPERPIVTFEEDYEDGLEALQVFAAQLSNMLGEPAVALPLPAGAAPAAAAPSVDDDRTPGAWFNAFVRPLEDAYPNGPFTFAPDTAEDKVRVVASVPTMRTWAIIKRQPSAARSNRFKIDVYDAASTHYEPTVLKALGFVFQELERIVSSGALRPIPAMSTEQLAEELEEFAPAAGGAYPLDAEALNHADWAERLAAQLQGNPFGWVARAIPGDIVVYRNRADADRRDPPGVSLSRRGGTGEWHVQALDANDREVLDEHYVRSAGAEALQAFAEQLTSVLGTPTAATAPAAPTRRAAPELTSEDGTWRLAFKAEIEREFPQDVVATPRGDNNLLIDVSNSTGIAVVRRNEHLWEVKRWVAGNWEIDNNYSSVGRAFAHVVARVLEILSAAPAAAPAAVPAAPALDSGVMWYGDFGRALSQRFRNVTTNYATQYSELLLFVAGITVGKVKRESVDAWRVYSLAGASFTEVATVDSVQRAFEEAVRLLSSQGAVFRIVAPAPAAPTAPAAAPAAPAEPVLDSGHDEWYAPFARELTRRFLNVSCRVNSDMNSLVIMVGGAQRFEVSRNNVASWKIYAWPSWTLLSEVDTVRRAFDSVVGVLLSRGATPTPGVSLATTAPMAPAAPARPAPATTAAQFPNRPKGMGLPWTPSGMDYMGAMIAPKCKMPVAFGYQRKHEVVTYAPDGSRSFCRGYYGSYERDAAGYIRQHMGPGVEPTSDFGKGTGPATYMAGAVMAPMIFDRCGGTFSADPSTGKYTTRTNLASAAWVNLVQHGTAYDTKEYAGEQTVDLMNVMKKLARARELGEFRNVEEVTPATARVKGYGTEVQQIDFMKILSLGIILHIPEDFLNKIKAQPAYRARGLKMCPPPQVFGQLDFTYCTPANVEEFIDFCSEHRERGVTKSDYRVAAVESLKKNPTSPMSPSEAEALLKGVRRRRNPEVTAEDQQDFAQIMSFLNDNTWE